MPKVATEIAITLTLVILALVQIERIESWSK